jgi:hypothetical protein
MGRSSRLCRRGRIKTRSLSSEQSFTKVYGEGSEWYGSNKPIAQSLIHRTMILTWIDELELAAKIWEEGVKESERLAELPHLNLGELLFRVVISERARTEYRKN